MFRVRRALRDPSERCSTRRPAPAHRGAWSGASPEESARWKSRPEPARCTLRSPAPSQPHGRSRMSPRSTMPPMCSPVVRGRRRRPSRRTRGAQPRRLHSEPRDPLLPCQTPSRGVGSGTGDPGDASLERCRLVPATTPATCAGSADHLRARPPSGARLRWFRQVERSWVCFHRSSARHNSGPRTNAALRAADASPLHGERSQ